MGETVDLWQTFVEQLLEEKAGRAGAACPALDWDVIWAAGDDADRPEEAIGRRVLLASQLVQEWTPSPVEEVVRPVTGPSAEPDSTALDRPVAATTALAPIPAQVMPISVMPVPAPTVPIVPVAEAPVAQVVRAPVPPAPVAPVPMSPVQLLPPALPSRTAAADSERDRRLMLASVFGWVRNVGVVVILFAAWQVWGTSIQHAHAQSSLQSEFTSQVHVHRPPESGPVLIPSSVRVPAPAQGTVLAHLVIPSIGVDQFVVEGTAAADLDKGPGHYVGTAMPGQQGNVAIAGHRTTYGAPFNRLDELAVGARAYVTTSRGQLLTYIVSQAPVAVSPSDVAVLNDAGDNRLTLTTCNPKFYATQRLVVVSTLQQPKPTHHVPVKRVIESGSSGWNLRYLPVALLATALLVLLGLYFGRFKENLGDARWVILVPIWISGLYVLFVALTGLLPATL